MSDKSSEVCAPGRCGSVGEQQQWRMARLGDVLRMSQYGLSVLGERTGRYPILRMNCQQAGRVIMRDLQYVSISERELEQYRLADKDLLFNRTNSYELVGRTAIYRGAGDVVFASYLLRLRVDETQVLPEFLNHWLNSGDSQRALKAIATRGVSQANISATRLRTLPVPLPPIREQAAMVNVLDRLLDRVEVSNARLSIIRQLKVAAITKLFREGLRGEPLRESEIGPIPASWDAKPLAAVADPRSGGTPSKQRADWWEGTVPWASPKDMKRLRLRDTEDHITPEAADLGSRLVPPNTIFVVIRGMILAKDVPVAIAEVPMAFNQDMKALVPTGAVDPDFLLYALCARKSALVQEIGTSAHGTRRMGSSSIEQLLVPVPKDDSEQKEIAKILNDLDRWERIATAKSESLGSLFHAMLHQLMTGAVRVTALDIPEVVNA